MTTTVIGTLPLYRGWTTLSLVTLRNAAGIEIMREVEHHGDGAAVLPYDPARRMVTLVGVPRASLIAHGGPQRLLEAPAGLIDSEVPGEAALRETEEEAGLRIESLEPVATAWSMPGLSTERLHLYLGAYSEASRVSAGGGLASENEDIEVVEITAAEFWALVESGGIADLKTLALAYALRSRHPGVFT